MVSMLLTSIIKALRLCRGPPSINLTQKLHAIILSSGYNSLFLRNTLLNAYLSCSYLGDARRVFKSISDPNVFSWNIMISGLAKLGLQDQARQVFDEMPERDSTSWNSLMSGYFRNGKFTETIHTFSLMLRGGESNSNMFTFNCAMKACGSLRSCDLAFQLHGFVEKCGFRTDPQVEGSIINMHLKCGAFELAARVFECSSSPSQFCWNSMILGYSKLAGVERALETFYKMPERDFISWNTVISVLSQHERGKETLSLIIMMHEDGNIPNSTTYTCGLSACASIGYLDWGRHFHARIVRSETTIDMFVGSALIDMYAKCGWLEAARRVFESLTEYNVVSWTSLISGYAQMGLVEESLCLFSQMRGVPVSPDEFTLATVISSCCTRSNLHLGTQLHSLASKIGCNSSLPVSNALVSMYAKCGTVDNALLVFESMQERNIISWTSMVTAYSQIGDVSKAREFFNSMVTKNIVSWNAVLAAHTQHGHEEEGLKIFPLVLKESVIRPDRVTFVTVLNACANIASLTLGTQIIVHSVKAGFESDSSVANGMIAFYSKCGRISETRKVFDSILIKDLVSWNAMITAYAQHGQGREAVEVFENMLLRGIEPDYISYVAVLSSCSHAGLLTEGRLYFDSMTTIHKISPGIEHFACMVDLFGRAGLFEQAKKIIENMLIQPSAEVWGALLGASKIHGNTEVAEFAAQNLFKLHSTNFGSYALLANIYTDAGKLEASLEVRKLIREKQAWKNPGCSWIEVKNRVHVFTAGDVNHPQICDIEKVLEELFLYEL